MDVTDINTFNNELLNMLCACSTEKKQKILV